MTQFIKNIRLAALGNNCPLSSGKGVKVCLVFNKPWHHFCTVFSKYTSTGYSSTISNLIRTRWVICPAKVMYRIEREQTLFHITACNDRSKTQAPKENTGMCLSVINILLSRRNSPQKNQSELPGRDITQDDWGMSLCVCVRVCGWKCVPL